MTNMMLVDSAAATTSIPDWTGLPISTTARADGLTGALLDAAVDAAIWSRATPASGVHWLNEIGPEAWPNGRFVLDPADIPACLKELFATVGVLSAPALTWLANDAAHLAQLIQHLVGSANVRLRLEPVFDNACSKFHIDNVVARLICTYSGPGTELSLEDSHVIQSVPTGAPVLLKGKRWPGADVPSLRHRSPPIAGTGIARLVLVIEGCDAEDINPGYDQIYPANSALYRT